MIRASPGSLRQRGKIIRVAQAAAETLNVPDTKAVLPSVGAVAWRTVASLFELLDYSLDLSGAAEREFVVAGVVLVAPKTGTCCGLGRDMNIAAAIFGDTKP